MKSAHFLKLDKTTSKDLSAGAFDYTTAYSRKFKLEQIIIRFSQNVSETVSIKVDSKHGSNYDIILDEMTLDSERDYVYSPIGECNFQDGDEINIQCTSSGGAGIAYCTIKTSEL